MNPAARNVTAGYRWRVISGRQDEHALIHRD
jgi:hypothetical protein